MRIAWCGALQVFSAAVGVTAGESAVFSVVKEKGGDLVVVVDDDDGDDTFEQPSYLFN